MLNTFAGSVRLLTGWRRTAVATGGGAASVLALAPFFAWPVLFVTLPILMWLIDGARERALACPQSPGAGALTRLGSSPHAKAAWTGWLFAFGYFAAGLFWIGEAFLVEAEKFALLLPVAVTSMPAGLALFWAGACAAASACWRGGFVRILALAVMLSLAEWLRGHVLTGFPWNVLGYALTWPLPLMQSAGVIGIYGLTLLAAIILPAPLVLLADGDGGSRRKWTAFAIAAVPLALMTAYGVLTLASPEPPPAGITVRIVQASVPQREKWRPENQERIFNDHLDLSHRNPAGVSDGAAGIRLIVWPEAAMPFLPLRSPAALAAIGRMLPKGSFLLSGALRLEEGDKPGDRRRVYNSLMAFGDGGRLAANYDKIHLVPFGEYLPLQETLEAIGLEQLSRLRGGFASGIEPRPPMRLGGLPVLGPLVCYEAIFPGEILQGGERPAALVNVTNDGWFGNTTGPRQHLHQARVRAVEEGLPLIRSANNGISAIVDGKGRVVASLGLDVKGSLDGSLPAASNRPVYSILGDVLYALATAVAGLAIAFRSKR